MLLRIDEGTEGWYQLIHAANDARESHNDLSIELVERNDGKVMLMTKVGERMWCPPMRTDRSDVYYPPLTTKG